MVQWLCNVTLKDKMSFDKFRDCLGLVSIRNCIQRSRVRWFGHKKCREIVVEGHRPQKTCDGVIQDNL